MPIYDRSNFALQIVRNQRDRIKHAFNDGIKADRKGAHDLVTDLDLEVEESLRSSILGGFPDDSILGEEETQVKGTSAYQWIIDPIDGTGNFVHGIPLFNVAIACLRRGEPIFGVVFAPILDELYSAEKRGDAEMDGIKLTCEETPLEHAFVSFCHGKDDTSISAIATIYEKMKHEAFDFRKLGSANLEICMVASGRIAAFVGHHIKPWDFIPACMVAEEAGCKVTGFQGQDWRSPDVENIVVAAPKLHEKLLGFVEDLT